MTPSHGNKYDKIFKGFHDAFKRAFKETGDDYKNLSWFYKNKKK